MNLNDLLYVLSDWYGPLLWRITFQHLSVIVFSLQSKGRLLVNA